MLDIIDITIPGFVWMYITNSLQSDYCTNTAHCPALVQSGADVFQYWCISSSTIKHYICLCFCVVAVNGRAWTPHASCGWRHWGSSSPRRSPLIGWSWKMPHSDWLRRPSLNLALPIHLSSDLLTQIHESVAPWEEKAQGAEITWRLLSNLWDFFTGLFPPEADGRAGLVHGTWHAVGKRSSEQVVEKVKSCDLMWTWSLVSLTVLCLLTPPPQLS